MKFLPAGRVEMTIVGVFAETSSSPATAGSGRVSKHSVPATTAVTAYSENALFMLQGYDMVQEKQGVSDNRWSPATDRRSTQAK
jgi:hypothetical protein